MLRIEPWLGPGLVVDRGCGTGALMKHLAARNRKVVGIEISDELCREEAGVIQANVMDAVFADGFVENIVLSSVAHEVFSYNGYSLVPVVVCLSNCARELRAGGRLIIRDIWAPGASAPDGRLEMDAGTWKLFEDFLERSPRPVQATSVDRQRRTATMAAADAVEFLSKKDYQRHWELELREIYTSVTISDYQDIARTLGLSVLHAAPLRNEWIFENRWNRGVRGELPSFTNQLVVLEKGANPVSRS